MAWFDPFGLGLFEACAGGSRPELPKAKEGEPAQASNKPKQRDQTKLMMSLAVQAWAILGDGEHFWLG